MPPSPRPVLLRPDNFTPASRTPWGGRRIVSDVKRELLAPDAATESVVGESWEVSVEPDFPSMTATGDSLDALIRAAPGAWLGARATAASAELLVKLLDAADELSVQIHPSDDYAALDPDQAGKPESWYVVDADEGACLYLGLAAGVTPESLRRALESDGDVASLLTKVPVTKGDFFVIEPGMPHAIGRGCLLVEPQRVSAGKKGVTYRFWDWNRRYDAEGRSSPEGAPRALHVEHALAVTRFDAPRDDAMLARVRRRAGEARLDARARLTPLAGPEGPILSTNLEVARLDGSGTTPFESGAFRGLTVLEGSVTVCVSDGRLEVVRGRSAALPASAEGHFDLVGAHALLSAVPLPRP